METHVLHSFFQIETSKTCCGCSRCVDYMRTLHVQPFPSFFHHSSAMKWHTLYYTWWFWYRVSLPFCVHELCIYVQYPHPLSVLTSSIECARILYATHLYATPNNGFHRHPLYIQLRLFAKPIQSTLDKILKSLFSARLGAAHAFYICYAVLPRDDTKQHVTHHSTPHHTAPHHATPRHAAPHRVAPGEARRGEARRGKARRGEARRGEARPGQARPGQDMLHNTGRDKNATYRETKRLRQIDRESNRNAAPVSGGVLTSWSHQAWVKF